MARLSRWVFAGFLLALFQVSACDCGATAEDAGPIPGQDAGSADDAGPDDDGGPPPTDAGPPPTDAGPPPSDAGPAAACGQISVLAATTTTGNGATAAGTLSPTDDFRGSCSSLYVGADAVVEFTAPAAGRYRFSTEASPTALDTILYLRTSCLSEAAELGCNDNVPGSVHSVVVADLAQDQTVYAVVDRYAGLDPAAFVLDVTEIAVHPPTLTAVDAFYNSTAGVLAFTASGQDLGMDVTWGQLQLLGAADAPLPIAGSTAPLEFDVDTAAVSSINWNASAYTVTFAAQLAAESLGVQKIRLTLLDEARDASTMMEVQAGTPSVVGNGAACDPALGFNVCTSGTFCDPSAAMCAAATAPTLTSAEAFVAPAVRAIGVQVAGTDAEQNPLFAQIRLLDVLGDPIQMLDNAGATVDVPPLLALLNVTAPGTTFSATASSRVPAGVPLNDVVSVEVLVQDDTYLASAPLTAALGTPPVLASGAACDIAGGLNTCPASELCGAEDPDAPVCLAEGSACPTAWSAINLNDHNNGGGSVFSYTGTTAAADNVAGRATCGGGGAQAVFAFTPPATDDWRFEISGTPTGADTLVFVRSECAGPQVEFEVSCNDNISLGGGNLLSRTEPALTQGQTVFVFVDGHYNPGLGYDGFAGPFTLTATRLYR